MLNVGVIGLGVGAKHVRAFERNPRCRTAAVCDIAPDKLQAIEREYPGIRITEQAEDILCSESIDLVSVASYDDCHAAQVETALEHGKHVFVEKPLCLYREEAVRIRAILKQRPSQRLSCNLNLRTCPRFDILRSRVGRGELGTLFHIEADYLWGRVEKLTDGWRAKMDYYSIILGASVHMVDLVLWLTGRRPIAVMSYGNHIGTAKSGGGHHDFNVMLLRFDNGMVAKIMASGACVHPHFHRLVVYGTRETFIHDLMGSARVVSAKPGANTLDVEGDYPAWEKKDTLLDSFVNAILGTGSPLVSEQDVFDALAVCFAAEQSAKAGGQVQIEYL